MATFRLRYFSSAPVLRAIDPERLLAFLRPHGAFFAGRGYDLPPAKRGVEIEYQKLVDIFMSPTEATPRPLLDALAFELGLIEQVTEASLPAHVIAVEKRAPYRCGVWFISGRVLRKARKENEQAMFGQQFDRARLVGELRKWFVRVQSEAETLRDGVVVIWHPAAAKDVVAEATASVVVEIEADSVLDALDALSAARAEHERAAA